MKKIFLCLTFLLLAGLHPVLAADPEAINISYRGHVQDYGNLPSDTTYLQDGQTLGTTGEAKRIEGFWIALSPQTPGIQVRYNVHIENEGWSAATDDNSNWKKDNEFAGSSGKSQRLEAIQIELTDEEGQLIPGLSVKYRVHVQNIGWQDWSTDGSIAGSSGLGLRIEAIEIQLVPKLTVESNLRENNYLKGDNLKVSPTVTNKADSALSTLLTLRIISPEQKVVYEEDAALQINAGESKLVDFSWTIPPDGCWGNYQLQLLSFYQSGDLSLLTDQQIAQIWCFENQDDFDFLDASIWLKSSHQLGRTQFQPQNVEVEKGQLLINLPAGEFNSGELQSRQLHAYGSYEISMKLPVAPSSITGFFLYAPPDYGQEIDIEIYNQPDSSIMFNTYANGKHSQSDQIRLSFDPTAEYHRYRINYQPDRLQFYIDGQLLKEYTTGLPDNPMYLMVNSWFPDWLDGIPPTESQKLYIDWIRY